MKNQLMYLFIKKYYDTHMLSLNNITVNPTHFFYQQNVALFTEQITGIFRKNAEINEL